MTTRSPWRLSTFAALVALTIAPASTRAQFGVPGIAPNQPAPTGELWRVEVTGESGKSVTGSLRIDTIQITSEFGLYRIKPEKVETIRFDDQDGQAIPIILDGVGQGTKIPGAVVPTSGDVIEGALLIPSTWTMTTDLGTLTLEPSRIRSITFLEGPLQDESGDEHEEEEDDDDDDEEEEDDDDDDEDDDDESPSP